MLNIINYFCIYGSQLTHLTFSRGTSLRSMELRRVITWKPIKTI